MVIRFFVFFINLLCFTSVSVAAVYQWRDENGRVHFSDVPATGAKQINTIEDRPDKADLERHRQIQNKLKQTVNRQGAERQRSDRALNYQRSKQKKAWQQAKKRCSRAREQLESTRKSWRRKGRKGYRKRDRLGYLERIRKLDKRVSDSC